MTEDNPQKKFIIINRYTGRQIVQKGFDFWKILPSSYKDAKGICNYYFTNKPCDIEGHISPRRTVNRQCLRCEISEESLNKNRKYYGEKKGEISERGKIKYKELTKDNIDARYNKKSPEKRLGEILEEIKSEKTLEEYIKGFDDRISKIIKAIENTDKYFLGSECKHGHNYGNKCLRIKSGSQTCHKCNLINDLIYRLKNKEKLNLKKCLSYHNLDPERKKERIQSAINWNKQNPELHKQSDEKWKKNNPEKRKEATRRDRKNHPARVNAYSAKYNADLIGSTPKWLSNKAYKQIEEKHETKQKLQDDTGVVYEVDHIMPLNNKICCGLHVPWNLKVITRTENRKKGNKLPSPDLYTANEQDRSDMIDKNWDTK